MRARPTTSGAATRAGFTFMEILLVAVILIVLAALATTAAMILRGKQGEATALHELDQLSSALSLYLGEHGRLGDPTMSAADVPDFGKRPYLYLVRRPEAAGKPAYYTPTLARMGDTAGHPVSTPAEAERLLDPFKRPIRWAIVNHPPDKQRFTRAAAVLSDRGSPNDQQDDVILAWRNEDGRWRRVAWRDLAAAEAVDSGARTGEQRDLAELKAAFDRERAALP